MLLPIDNDKKSILNKMVLIYFPNRQNPKRICSDFLCFISRQNGENIVMTDIKW